MGYNSGFKGLSNLKYRQINCKFLHTHTHTTRTHIHTARTHTTHSHTQEYKSPSLTVSCSQLLSLTHHILMEWKPTDVTILFVYCWISTCFGPTGPSSGEFVQLFTQPLVQYLYRSVRVLANRAVPILNQWLCEQLYELFWRWACGPETCRDPAIYE